MDGLEFGLRAGPSGSVPHDPAWPAGVRNRNSGTSGNSGLDRRDSGAPNAPSYSRGVINLRGTVVPVLDLRHKFHMPVPDDDRLSVTVVVRVGGRVVGLVVDGVSDVLDILPDAISPPPTIGEGFEVTSLSGIALRPSPPRVHPLDGPDRGRRKVSVAA